MAASRESSAPPGIRRPSAQPSERAAAAGVPLRQVEAPAGASVARRAQAAVEGSDRRLQIFLTAPAVPLPGWLPSILALLGPDRDAGVVGARIVSRFGVLEEAGRHPGCRRQARATRARGTPILTDPSTASSRGLTSARRRSSPPGGTCSTRLGGFDQGPTAQSDALVDFSLRAGEAGSPVYYQPQARVVAIGNGDR